MVTEEEGVLLVRKFTDSELSGRKYCRDNGIKRGTLRYWLDRVNDYELGKEIDFCEVVIRIFAIKKLADISCKISASLLSVFCICVFLGVV